jgi:hypothetical protein
MGEDKSEQGRRAWEGENEQGRRGNELGRGLKVNKGGEHGRGEN